MDSLKLWLEALRSKRYKQGTGHLRDKDTFCCLGVACEVYQEMNKDLEIVRGESFFSYGRRCGTLPEKVRSWLKLQTNEGHFGETSLIELNDSGNNFEQIADIIESRPHGLFETVD